MTERPGLLRAGLALALAALFVASLVGGILFRRHRPAPPRPQLMVAFLDVGAGDCTLIRTPGGRAILVDAGPAAAGPLVVQTLQRQGVHALDLLVLAAPTPGSIGGAISLLNSGMPIARVWECPFWVTGGEAGEVLRELRRRRIPSLTVKAGDTFSRGGATLTALWPPAQGTRGRPDALVCRLDYGTTGVVLAGPADADEASYLVADAGELLNCDVLQVADGGADGATTPELLRRATPSVAVISGGASAPPGPLTLHRLEAAGAAVWRTETRLSSQTTIQGAVTVFTDGRSPPSVTSSQMTER